MQLLVLQASTAAVESDLEALAGEIGVERVIEHRSGAILDQQAHRVLDGNALAEDILVSEVSVVPLVLQVEAS